jgi:hypothetical protein
MTFLSLTGQICTSLYMQRNGALYLAWKLNRNGRFAETLCVMIRIPQHEVALALNSMWFYCFISLQCDATVRGVCRDNEVK